MNFKQAFLTTVAVAAISIGILEMATAKNKDDGFLLPPPTATEVKIQDEVARAIAAAFKSEKQGSCRTAKLKLTPDTHINTAYISRGVRKAVKGARIAKVKKVSPYLLKTKYLDKKTLKKLCLSFEGIDH